MHPRLESRRANSEPKCANCGWFEGGDMPAGRCGRHDVKTLDLAVCTDWRDGDVTQTVLPPEKDE